MSDLGDDFRAVKEFKRKHFGVPCPKCREDQPKRQPTILMPGGRCRVHIPVYFDPRPEITQADIDAAMAEDAA